MSAIKESLRQVSVFAPATCANVAVGFDSLGFAFNALGDTLTLTKRNDSHIVIEHIDGKESLPLDQNQNTASVALMHLCQALELNTGFSIHLRKGIPLSSGLGGSAASAVAAVVACNHFLKNPLSLQELTQFALLGENINNPVAHADNVVPCLFGGLTLIASQNPLEVVQLPIPSIYCVLLHPQLQITTAESRMRLNTHIALSEYVQQSALMGGFIAALYAQDFSLLKKTLRDTLIEKQRANMIPGFYAMKEAALAHGALGMSLSGSGPTLFAWAQTEQAAKTIAQTMQAILNKENIGSAYWIGPISNIAAHVYEEK